jgi:hypothetical protein
MVETVRRTPGASLREIFLRAAATLPERDQRGEVVAEALGYLQEGFGAHYAGGLATDDEILVGDYAYARAVETIATLDEPRFVGVASRMIRDGAGEISRDIISGEGEGRSEVRVRRAVGEVTRGGE